MDPKELSAFSNLRKWMTCHGFRPPDELLRVAVFPDTGRGLQAVRDIAEGETIISIPKRFLITTETVLCNSLGRFLMKLSTIRLSPLQVLCLFLMVEKARNFQSEWRAYVDVLPPNYTTPAYYPSKDIHLFTPTVQMRIAEQKLLLKLEYEKLRPLLESVKRSFELTEGDVGFELFRWAWFTVNTRCVFMEQLARSQHLNHERNCYALAPFLDLFNHSCQTRVQAGFVAETNCYEIKTLVRISRNDQIFINYGFHDNVTLLLEYGFVLPKNIHSSVRFYLDDIILAIKAVLEAENAAKVIAKIVYYGDKDLCCTWEGPTGDLALLLTRCNLGEELTAKLFNSLCRNKMRQLKIQESRGKPIKTWTMQMADALIAEENDILSWNCKPGLLFHYI